MALTGHTGWVGTVLGTPDPAGLAAFWAELLGGTPDVHDETFATLRLGTSSAYLAFQLEPDHVPPTWPAGPADQQMQAHLDIGVHAVDVAVAEAVAAGARLADHQPQHDVRVLVDPAGHPFCLYLDRGA